MARLARLVVPQQPHLIVQSGVDSSPVFRESADYQAFLNWLRDAAKLYKVALHAYVLLPSEVQLLATPDDSEGLAKMMQWVGRHYVPYFNRKYARAGTLWRGRFQTSVIEASAYLMLCCRFLECGPVRAELSSDPADYPWSSYLHHIGARHDPLITDHPLYWALGNTPFEREAEYKQLAEQALTPDQLHELKTNKGWALGSLEFRVDLEKQMNRQVSPGRRGRPAKLRMPGATSP